MYVVLIAAMIFISATLAGMFTPPFKVAKEDTKVPSNYECCDTGSGPDCKPVMEKQISYNTKQYALLKSNILPINKIEHAQKHFAPAKVPPTQYGRIFTLIYERNGDENVSSECLGKTKGQTDWMIGPVDPDSPEGDVEHLGKGCYAIPNELIIYVCRLDNDHQECDQGQLKTDEVQFDAYIRLEDIQEGGSLGKIPYPIANCVKPPLPPKPEKMIEFRPSPGGQANLQLRTFKFIEKEEPLPFLSPYCKPAIYLYPQKKTEVNVSIYPKGKMLMTIPPYPKLGWDVIAEPNGVLHYQNSIYDYLYYEASIPDQLIKKPSEGYVVPYDERESFMRDLVIKLGLNEKETAQFVEYWTPILPKSPYYFIGVVPVANLNEISPVLITPRPDNLIRVTLYFQALDKPISVTPPSIIPVKRTGFTAVEWGGIFKQDKEHPFSCFM